MSNPQIDEELEKILIKAFEDIRKRVTVLIAKREKKFEKALKAAAPKKQKKPAERNESVKSD